jgi:hypothetical protein
VVQQVEVPASQLGPQEDDTHDDALNVNIAGRRVAGGTTTLEARGYLSRFSEESDGRLAPPQSTPTTGFSVRRISIRLSAILRSSPSSRTRGSSAANTRRRAGVRGPA